MRFDRMLRQGIALAASISMVTVWPAAPVFAADKNINLDGNSINGNESNVALNVISTSPTTIKDKVTNKAVNQSFRLSWAGGGPGGFFTSVGLGNATGVGAIWNWATIQQVFSINSTITFNQTAPGTVTRTFTDIPGRSLTSAGVTTSSASLTSSLITFFSPPQELVRVTSSVTPVAGGVFKYEREITNLTDDPIDFEWQPGPLGCDGEFCGNGVAEGSEQCDGSDLNEASCEVFGGTGDLGCLDGCEFDFSGCADVCGNGVRDDEEQCEGSNLGGETCVSQGYASGDLACDSECGFDFEGCVAAVCGNGVQEGFESCDGSDLNDSSCVSLGYMEGTLDCSLDCVFDTSGCVPFVCGNGIREGFEECDGSDLGGGTCVTEGHACGLLFCTEGCLYDDSECSDICLGGSSADTGEPSDGGPLVTSALRSRTLTELLPTKSRTINASAGGRTSGTSGLSDLVTLGTPPTRSPGHPRSSPRPMTSPLGEISCDFDGLSGRLDGNSSTKTCEVSAHPAKEVTSQIIVCGDGLPSGPQGCGNAADSGSQGTANVLVPALNITIGDAFLSAVHVAIQDGANGFAEPGETFDMFVGLINTGPQDLNDVTATLSAVPVDIDGDGTPDAPTILQAVSSYPTIPGFPAGTADCDSPAAALQPVYNITAFRVSLPAGFPVDTNLHFVLDVDGTTVPVALGAFSQSLNFVAGVGSACSLTNLDGSYSVVDGFLSPMGPLVPKGDPFPEDSSASTNRTRPLKLRLFCGTTNLTDAFIDPPKIVSLTRDGVPIDVSKVDLNDNANSNSLLFRFANGFWIYNMRTKLLGHGTFVVTIQFPNGQEYWSQFVL